MKILQLLITIFIFSISTNARAQTIDKNSVDIIPKWLKGETHSVKIKSKTTNIINGKPETYLSTFDATFKVLEVAESGYKIEWTYTNSKLATRDLQIENHIIAKLLNKKIIVNLSEVGTFDGLENVTPIKIATDKIVHNLIANSSTDKEMNLQFKAVEQLIQSKRGLEVAILKQVKFYIFSMGYNYKLNAVQSNDIQYPNPMGGEPFTAKETVELTKLDNDNSICVIETNKTVASEAIRETVYDLAKKISKEAEDIVQNEFRNNGFEISESTMQQIDFSKSILQKGYFKRVMKLGLQNRTTLLEIGETE